MGRLDTCYAPVRRSPSIKASFDNAAPRLACVKPVASVHPEPGSNSSSSKYLSWLQLSSDTCLICEDACPGLLNLYPIRILTVQHSTACVATNSHTYLFLVLQISVYVNLSKNVLPKRAHQRSATPSERRLHLICGCKGTLFPRTGKTFRGFFRKKMHFCHPYIIYYICARKKGMGGEGSYGIAPYGTAGRRRGCALNFVNEAIIARMGTLFKGK